MKIIAIFILALLLTVVFSACSTETSVSESLYKESEIENDEEYESIIISSEIFDLDLVTKYEFRVRDEDWNFTDIVIENPEDVETISSFLKDMEIIVSTDGITCDCGPDVLVWLSLSDGRNYRFGIERLPGGPLVLEYNMDGIFTWIIFVNIAFDDFMELILNFADTDLDEPLPSLPTNPHPLAEALWNYMAGNIAVYRKMYTSYPDIDIYDLFRISSEILFAMLVTLDDNGTAGVLLQMDDGAMSQVLLYVYDDELFYSVVGWGCPLAGRVFVEGRYNRLMFSDGAFVGVYTLESGNLVFSSSWSDDSFWWDDSLDGFPFYFNGQPVTEDEFNALVERARARYGLDVARIYWFDREDQTAQILAMTINCVPSFINE